MLQPEYDPNFKYISITQMNTLLGCPFKWYLEREVKEKAAQPFIFLFGSAFHETEDKFLQARMAGEEKDLLWLLETFSKEWAREIKEGETSARYNGIDWVDVFGEKNSPDYLESTGKQMIAAFHKHINPRLIPVQSEQMHHIDIPGARGWKLTIKTDMAGPHPETGEWCVYDHKTSLFPWKKGKSDTELQATGSLWANNKVNTKSFNFVYNIVTKGMFGKPIQAYQEETTRTQADLDYFEEQMRQCIRTIKGGGFIMRPESKVHEYCPFRDKCKAGHMFPAKERVVAAQVGDIEV